MSFKDAKEAADLEERRMHELNARLGAEKELSMEERRQAAHVAQMASSLGNMRRLEDEGYAPSAFRSKGKEAFGIGTGKLYDTARTSYQTAYGHATSGAAVGEKEAFLKGKSSTASIFETDAGREQREKLMEMQIRDQFKFLSPKAQRILIEGMIEQGMNPAFLTHAGAPLTSQVPTQPPAAPGAPGAPDSAHADIKQAFGFTPAGKQ
jgi:hypothetical protein